MTSTNTSIPPHKIFCFLGNHADSIHLPSYTHVLQNLFQIIQKRRVQTMRKLTKTAAVVASMAVMAMGTAVMTSAAQEGWVQKGADWYFYVNGNAVENQWALTGDKWYFLGEDGKMVKNAFINDGVEIDYDSEEDIPEGGNEEDPVYFVGSDGAMVTGWIQIDLKSLGGTVTPKTSKTWYYFGGSGYMFGDQWVASGNDWYYLSPEGKMKEKGFDESGDYYLTKGGKMATGWYKLTSDDAEAINDAKNSSNDELEENDYIFADKDGELQTGWVKDNGKWYYIDENYGMIDDGFTPDGKFYLKSGGAMATGYTKVNDNEYYFFDTSNGEMKTNKFQKVGSRYYYFGADGRSFADQIGKNDTIFYIEETKKNGASGEKFIMATDPSLLGATTRTTSPVSFSAAKVNAITTVTPQNIDDAADYFKESMGNEKDGYTYKIYKLGSGTTKTVKAKAKTN